MNIILFPLFLVVIVLTTVAMLGLYRSFVHNHYKNSVIASNLAFLNTAYGGDWYYNSKDCHFYDSMTNRSSRSVNDGEFELVVSFDKGVRE